MKELFLKAAEHYLQNDVYKAIKHNAYMNGVPFTRQDLQVALDALHQAFDRWSLQVPDSPTLAGLQAIWSSAVAFTVNSAIVPALEVGVEEWRAKYQDSGFQSFLDDLIDEVVSDLDKLLTY
ncbi:hypothetical protein [Thermus phage TSP4]|nr:hypothetical protein [Thermus phage TSP4]